MDTVLVTGFEPEAKTVHMHTPHNSTVFVTQPILSSTRFFRDYRKRLGAVIVSKETSRNTGEEAIQQNLEENI